MFLYIPFLWWIIAIFVVIVVNPGRWTWWFYGRAQTVPFPARCWSSNHSINHYAGLLLFLNQLMYWCQQNWYLCDYAIERWNLLLWYIYSFPSVHIFGLSIVLIGIQLSKISLVLDSLSGLYFFGLSCPFWLSVGINDLCLIRKSHAFGLEKQCYYMFLSV